jgi:hypothetical protein
MKRSVAAVAVLMLVVVGAACAQSTVPKPSPGVKKWAMWDGNWTMVGTAKDEPSQPEYKLEWRDHEHWILGGFAQQGDSTWKGNGQELHFLEIASYDPAKKANTFSGFGSDGTIWIGTAIFNDRTSLQNMTVTGPDGKVATCRNEWVFSADGKSVSAKSECEQDGVRWVAYTVKGTRTKDGS